MEELERARERLENIRSVKPILNGLRTISLGSWQAALKRRSGVRAYAERLKAMLPLLAPHLQPEQPIIRRLRERLSFPLPLPGSGIAREKKEPDLTRVKALVIGSERGLCGRYNVAIVDETERYLRHQSQEGADVELLVLGSRAKRILGRRGYDAREAGKLSVTTLPPFSLAFRLADSWLAAYEKHELDTVHLIYNDYQGTGAYEPTVTPLIPPRLPQGGAARSKGEGSVPGSAWPPPIIDTDPLSLYATVVEQWAAVQLYEVLLDSSAAEHSTRFQLMESATQNADQLVDELTLVIQTARRQAITQEMTELAAGAGLIGEE
ncbi:MAG: F0F1 ATP synthase subunit gamma [Anaerolineae bacterium]|nr:F0F1 ATP synthase subunit gamma [Anaerolineae bacterium]